MISGTVVTVNDRQMVVNTDQGEQVTLEMDSRTMAPRDLAPGMVMRAEFLALEDCRFYARRITPLRGGMPTDRLQAYANTQDSRGVIARSASARASLETPEKYEGGDVCHCSHLVIIVYLTINSLPHPLVLVNLTR